MKRLLCILALTLMLACLLASCGDDEISVSEDGYLVVNGEKTEHKVHTKPMISVIDGYVAVNGVKTEYEVNTADSITVEDGYLVVNGEKTEYEVKNKNHSFGDWKLYNEDETDCEKKLYYRTCPDCSIIEWKEGKYEDHDFTVVTTEPTCQAGGYDTKTCNTCGKVEVCNETPISDHKYKTEYSFDSSFHWYDCENCTAKTSPAEHTEGEDGFCTDCGQPLSATEGVIYGISSDGTYAEVVGYSGTATKVIISDTYEGVPVKVIYKEAFKNNDKITKVLIPDSVTEIGDNAFDDCESLKSVTIPDSVTTIGDWAFDSCDSLESVTIGDSVTTIGYYAFWYCTSLESVTIPDSVTEIGSSAFSGCTSLTSVTVKNAAASIGSSAFSGCNSSLYTEYEYGKYVGDAENPYAMLIGVTNKNLDTYKINEKTKIIAYGVFRECPRLKNITIPDSVTAIGSDAFYDCNSLTSVHISDIANWCGITFAYASSNPLSYAKNLYLNGELVTELVIPEGVTSIGNYAFCGCDSLTSVTIPDSVTAIGYSAFSGCTSLTSVTIPDSVTTIGSSAFRDCNSLKSVTIPDSVTTIGYSAFYYCTRLESVTIPDSVNMIASYAFYHCDSLTNVTIPNSVTEIGDHAFAYCDILTDVYYKGGGEEWLAIEIGGSNSKLENATIHYNYTEE